MSEDGVRTPYRWWRFVVMTLMGVWAGAFSSWYIFGNIWSWPAPVLIAAFVIGAVREKTRIESTPRQDRSRPTA